MMCSFYSENICSDFTQINSNLFTLHTGNRTGDGIITTSRKPVLLIAYAPVNSALTVTFIANLNKTVGYWLRMEKVSDTSYKITNAQLDGKSVEVEYWWI